MSPARRASSTPKGTKSGAAASGLSQTRLPKATDSALDEALRRALDHAGFKTPQRLSQLRAHEIALTDRVITATDLERLHTEVLRARYASLGIKSSLLDTLVRHRVPLADFNRYFTRCGDGVYVPPGTPGDFKVPPDFLKQIPDELKHLVEHPAWEDLLRPNWPIPDPEPEPDWMDVGGSVVQPPMDSLVREVELIAGRRLMDMVYDANEAHKLITRGLKKGDTGRALVLAQLAMTNGDHETAQRLAVSLGRLDRKSLTDTQRYQADALAPLIAGMNFGSGARPAVRLKAARQAVEHATSGSAAFTMGVRQFLRESRLGADRAAGVTHGLRNETARHARTGAYARVLAGHGLTGNAAKKAAIPAQAVAAMVDVLRASRVAPFTAYGPMIARSETDQSFSGRMIPRNGALDLLGATGIGSILDDFIRADLLHTWGKLYGGALHPGIRALSSPPIFPTANIPSVSLPGDLFRFDWLLGEARTLIGDASRIEQLILGVVQMALDTALSKLDLVTGVVNELTQLVQQLVDKVNALAARIPELLGALIGSIIDAAMLAGLLHALKNWPHDNWIAVIMAIVGAIGAGANPATAALASIHGLLTTEIGKILGDVRMLLDGTLVTTPVGLASVALPQLSLPAIQAMLDAVGFPAEVETSLTNALTLAGMSVADVAAILQPLKDAVAAVDVMTLAKPRLDELDALITAAAAGTLQVPAWMDALMLVWVAAPLIAFAVWIPITKVIGLGVVEFLFLFPQYLIALILRIIGAGDGKVAEIMARAIATLNEIRGVMADLIQGLTNLGGLQASINGLTGLLGILDTIADTEVLQHLHASLLMARDVVLGSAFAVTKALDRSFFRETLEVAPVLPDAFDLEAPSFAAPMQIAGLSDPNFGASAVAARVISNYERTRIDAARSVDQVLTQVISLVDLKGLPAVQGILNGIPLGFELTQEVFDQFAPGVHRARLKDLSILIDLDLDQLAVAGGAAGSALSVLSAVVDKSASLAGGVTDPVLDGRIKGPFPGLPVVPGRIPTGIPAVLTHAGVSRYRLKPSPELDDRMRDACNTPLDFGCLDAPLQNAVLKDDVDGANEAGWKILEIHDEPGNLLFSHFDILGDTVRFIMEPKQLKPFEHRGLIGAWSLEIPSITLGSIHWEPTTLPIRDVRLVFSAVGQYDRSLAELVKLPLMAGPTAPLPGSAPPGAGGVASIDAVLAALEASFQDLQAKLTALASSVTGVTSTLDVAAALQTTLLTQLTSIGNGTAAGNTLAAVVLSLTDLTSVQKAAALTGTLTPLKTVDAALLTGKGINPAKVVRVVAVNVIPLLSGAPLTPFPTAQSALSFTPTVGAAKQVLFTLDANARSIPGTSFGAGGNPPAPLASPLGVWAVDLPPLIPAALIDLAVGLILEVAP